MSPTLRVALIFYPPLPNMINTDICTNEVFIKCFNFHLSLPNIKFMIQLHHISIFLPASPTAEAGLRAGSLSPSVRPNKLVIATPMKLLIRFS